MKRGGRGKKKKKAYRAGRTSEQMGEVPEKTKTENLRFLRGSDGESLGPGPEVIPLKAWVGRRDPRDIGRLKGKRGVGRPMILP